MAMRPFAFGMRLRSGERSLRVRAAGRGYVLEEQRTGGAPVRRRHPTLESALRDAARTRRGWLH